jgi:hypothetical protein
MKLACGLIVAVLATGCSKNSDVEAFIKANDALAADLKDKAGKEGPEAVKKAFDGKKEDLRTRYTEIKSARGFQVSAENKKGLGESVSKSTQAICGLQLKVIMDRDKSKAYSDICKEYSGLFK